MVIHYLLKIKRELISKGHFTYNKNKGYINCVKSKMFLNPVRYFIYGS